MSQDTALAYVHERQRGRCTVEVILGEGDDALGYTVWVDDSEPDDVWGPILQRAMEEAFFEADRPLGEWRVVGFSDVKSNHPEEQVFLLQLSEEEGQ